MSGRQPLISPVRSSHLHPSNRLYNGEVEDAGDAMRTLIAACDFEIAEFTSFKSEIASGELTERSGLSAEEIQASVDSDKAIKLLVAYKRAADYALIIYSGLADTNPDTDEDELCERVGTILHRRAKKWAVEAGEEDFANSLTAIADAFEAQDWATLAI